MFNFTALTELSRQRQLSVAHDVAECHLVRSPRTIAGRALVTLGALAVCLGNALTEESERRSKTAV